MLIAQITDLHVGFEPDNPDEYNTRRLRRVLDQILEGPNKPDLVIATGDLTERGDVDSYKRCADMLAEFPCPVYPIPGNHDLRTNFSRAFPDVPTPGGFAQYTVDAGPIRLILLDTLEEGRHGGAFCEIRAAWLAERLAEDTAKPTVIVMHHPPMDVGIDWMRTDPDEPWVARFAGTIAGHGQIKAILCGHLHRPIVSPWRGVLTAVCPAVAPGVTLDLRPMDPERPDLRPMVVADMPGYGFHWWNGSELVSLYDYAEETVPLAKFDGRMQGLVKHLLAERPGAVGHH
ncbi:MAG: phosphodiesterase [Sphingomonas sp.]